MPDGNVTAYQNADQWSEFIFTESLSAGIEGVTLDTAKRTSVFSLSNRRLTAPARGINIIGGKKVVIKR